MRLIASLLLVTSSVFAGETITTELYCDKTADIIKTLRKDHRESPVAIGIANDEASSTMSIWTNPVTKTWTILATKDGLSCVVGVGDKFDITPLKKSTYY